MTTYCPYCKHEQLIEGGADGLPEEGDMTVCTECYFVSMFTNDSARRMPTKEERKHLSDCENCKTLLQRLIKKLRSLEGPITVN